MSSFIVSAAGSQAEGLFLQQDLRKSRNIVIPFGTGSDKESRSGIQWKCHFSLRCGPCLRIAPAFNALSNKYPQATFLEVDVHQCQVCARERGQGTGALAGTAPTLGQLNPS